MSDNKKKKRALWLLAALLLLLTAGSFLYQQYSPAQKISMLSLGVSGSIENGQIVSGNIPNNTTIDSYTFTVDAGDVIAVSVSEIGTDTDFKPKVQLKKPNGTSGGAGQGNFYARWVTSGAVAGTWTVEVTRYDNKTTGGDYELIMVKVPGALSISGGNSGGVMYPGQTYSGTIVRGDVDIWTFVGGSTSPVAITGTITGGSGFRSYFQAYDANGTSKGAIYPTTTATLNVGSIVNGDTYTVLVYKGEQNDVTGTYTISATSSAPPTVAKADGANCFNCCVGGVAVGDPINVATGNLYEEVTDYATAGTNPLSLTRYYNSQSYTRNLYPAMLGVNWRSNYDRYLRKLHPWLASDAISANSAGILLSIAK
ncbi:MAG: DUF6531 domain-containing protein [Micavibrio sp.]